MQTWIITTTPRVGDLVALARRLGGPVRAVLVGPDVDALPDVSEALHVTAAGDVPLEALAPVVVGALSLGPGDIVLVPNRRTERVLAGAVAAAFGAALLTGASEVTSGTVSRTRFGGIAAETIDVTGPVVLLLDGGPAHDGTPVAGTAVSGVAHPATVTGTETVPVAAVDLGSASRVVTVGRGFKQEADLDLARKLAGVLGAELACSRPLAEGSGWLPKDRYVGVSGQRISPDLDVLLGVSGQLQHMVGATGAGTIVAVNNDPKAPVFAQADYGIVGDLYDVLPALTAALR